MSTRSYICQETDQGYQCVYCHWDGYPENNGKILLENYKDARKVNDLISQGDMSLLGANIVPDKQRSHSFENRQDNVCVFYHRDRKEPWENTKPKLIADLNGLRKIFGIAYVYIYSNNKWYYLVNGKIELLPKDICGIDD